MKKLYIRHASELVTCRGKAPRRGREMADIGLIEDGAVLLSDGRIEAVGTTKELDQRLGLIQSRQTLCITRRLLYPPRRPNRPTQS